MKRLLIAVLSLAFSFSGSSQNCSTLGQTPSAAFPVCGNAVFHQKTVPVCRTHVLFVPGCPDDPINPIIWDTNPYWYKFTCYRAGSLGFVISPLDPDEDYDWQLYDITGHDPSFVFVDTSIVVTGNWSGTPGNTGTSGTGSAKIECGSFPDMMINPFAAMPHLIEGHNYLLLVSHWSATQSGYDLSFGGGTSLITATDKPNLQEASSNCAATSIHIKLNKKINCSTIASDGSDFYITPSDVIITSALGINCYSAFDTDSIELMLNNPLGFGTFNVLVNKGSDGNTLLDMCDNPIPEGEKVSFTILPPPLTPMDSLAPLSCRPGSLKLVFSGPILCSTIAPDGSDFVVTGSYPVAITAAKGNCPPGEPVCREILLLLDQPFNKGGSFILALRKGTDGNTLRNECNVEIPIGSNLSFNTKDTVNADFTYKLINGCASNTVKFIHAGGNGINSWQWNLDENQLSHLQSPQVLYSGPGRKTVTLTVSNGLCSDTSSRTFTLSPLKADFDTYTEICPKESIKFTSLAQGVIIKHNWQFGDGATSIDSSPSHIYSPPTTTTPFVVRYTVIDSFGCQSSLAKTIRVYSSCYIAVPNAFTPNGDGRNDFLAPLNAIKADNLVFKVYDRWGKLVYQTSDWKIGWDGTRRGELQPAGVYAWQLSFVDHNTKELRQMKGTSVLIR